MFKSQEQITSFVDKIEKFIDTRVHLALLSSQGLDGSAKQDAVIYLNRSRAKLEEFLQAISGVTPATDTTDSYTCPDCGSDMKLRTNRQNGDKFWGCTKYPDCRGTRDENGLSREERNQKKEVVQEGGFSFNKSKRNPVTEVGPDS